MTAVVPTARTETRGGGAAALWSRVKVGVHRRAGRVEWIVLVLVMLLPQLAIVLLDTR
jgi:hypothetical protein